MLLSENLLAAVLGPNGIGKSTLLMLFYQQLHEAAYVKIHYATEQNNLVALMGVIEDIFDIKIQSLDSIEERLDDLIGQLQFKDKPCVLLIDEAGSLPEENH